jgi:F-type H+-transporting ATPase subunit a
VILATEAGGGGGGGGLHFPPIDEILRWKPVFGEGTWYAFNKVGFISLMAMVATLLLFFLAGKKRALVPTGVQNLAEIGVDFIREGIIAQTMGSKKEDVAWTGFLTALFFFIIFTNVTGIIPVLQMPATARMGIPAMLAIISWVLFIFMGFKKNGIGYIKAAVVPPGVPKALLPLVVLIEIVSTFLVRPFSLAVRLFANMLAGHLLLVTFAVMGHGLFFAETKQAFFIPLSILPLILFIAITVFEVLVVFLQAYIFTILTAVYLGGAMHPEH